MKERIKEFITKNLKFIVLRLKPYYKKCLYILFYV